MRNQQEQQEIRTESGLTGIRQPTFPLCDLKQCDCLLPSRPPTLTSVPKKSEKSCTGAIVVEAKSFDRAESHFIYANMANSKKAAPRLTRRRDRAAPEDNELKGYEILGDLVGKGSYRFAFFDHFEFPILTFPFIAS